MSSLKLDKDLKLNPVMTTCYVCCKEKKEILLLGKAASKIKDELGVDHLPSNIGIVDKTPCEECQKHMKEGIILLSVKEEKEQGEEPERTGGYWVITEQSFLEIVGDPNNPVFKSRIAFISDEVVDELGLPKYEIDKLGSSDE